MAEPRAISAALPGKVHVQASPAPRPSGAETKTI